MKVLLCVVTSFAALDANLMFSVKIQTTNMKLLPHEVKPLYLSGILAHAARVQTAHGRHHGRVAYQYVTQRTARLY